MLVSAPHACNHIRDGVNKMAEEFTGAMAVQLAASCGCHAIVTTHNSTEDPNWQAAGAYKNKLAELVRRHRIRFVIDLHGMTNRYRIGVALGTMRGRSVAAYDVVAPFVSHGFVATALADVPEPLRLIAGEPVPEMSADCRAKLVVDHPRFTGGLRNHTITRFACEQLGIAAVQVEVAAVNRIVFRAAAPDWPYEYSGNPAGIIALNKALAELVKSV